MINRKVSSVDSDRPGPSPDPPDIGSKIRRLRSVYGQSQRDLAKLAGVTNGAISMIEQNRVSPSIASLKKILEAFGLTLGEFFASEFEVDTKFFYRAGEMNRIADGLVTFRQVGTNIGDRKLQVLHEVYAPGGDTGPTMLTHAGEEAGVVVRGQIEITVGGQTETLGPGDGYYFPSRIPHRFRNIETEDAEVVSTCTPPTF